MIVQHHSRIACAALLLSVGAFAGRVTADPGELKLEDLPPAASADVDFARDIQPILAAACYKCHGPDTQESGLRLDVRKAALDGADSGPVIVPGKSSKSRLIHLVAGLDKDTGRMPPEDAAEPLIAPANRFAARLDRSWRELAR